MQDRTRRRSDPAGALSGSLKRFEGWRGGWGGGGGGGGGGRVVLVVYGLIAETGMGYFAFAGRAQRGEGGTRGGAGGASGIGSRRYRKERTRFCIWEKERYWQDGGRRDMKPPTGGGAKGWICSHDE